MLKFDFTRDLYTNEVIDFNLLTKRKTYFSDRCREYHEGKYKKEFRFILSEFFEIPKCPVSEEPVMVYCEGLIKFAQFKPKLNRQERNKFLAETDKFKAIYKRFSEEREGENNPMFGKESWNKGLTKETNEIVKKYSEKQIGKVISDETKEKQSKKRRENISKGVIGGMNGKKHSDESKQKMRAATIQRLKDGKFPQTNTSINIIFENLLKELNLQYEKEFLHGHFCFDFKVKNYLIEIQGDYWHWNPKIKFKRKVPPLAVSRNIKRDKAKKLEVEKINEFKFLEFWETDINNNLKDIKACLKKLLM